MAEESCEVVVAGGGIVGCSVAYFLAARGVSVVLMDPGGLGSGSSGHATGSLSMLGAEFEHDASFDLALAGYRVFGDIVDHVEEVSGVSMRFQRRPSLRLALEPEEEASIRDAMAWQTKYLPVEWVEKDRVHEIDPRLSDQIRGAAFEPESSQVDSYLATMAFGQAAERLGARVVARGASGLDVQSGRVTAVHHEGGSIACGSVVLAMGPWAEEASAWLGLDIPVVPMKGERLLLRYAGDPLPVFISSPRRGHMISMLDGLLSVGSTGGRDYDRRDAFRGTEFDNIPTEAAMMELMQRAIDVFPDLENAEIVQQLAGSRPLSGDLRPLIGPVPGVEGAFLATGHTTKGVHLGPVTGELIANLITEGAFRTSADIDIDKAAFAPARFSAETAYDYEALGDRTDE